MSTKLFCQEMHFLLEQKMLLKMHGKTTIQAIMSLLFPQNWGHLTDYISDY